MSNFEARIQKQKEAIEQERKKKEAEKQAAFKEAKARDNQRLDRIKNDERYLQMKEIAYSQELREALEVYIGVFKSAYSFSSNPVEISFSAQKDPVGSFNIRLTFQDYVEGIDEYDSIRGTYGSVIIFWRDEPLKRKLKSRGDAGKRYTSDVCEGVDAKAGLGIEFKNQWHIANNRSALVFYDLESFLDYLANLIIKKRENRGFDESYC